MPALRCGWWAGALVATLATGCVRGDQVLAHDDFDAAVADDGRDVAPLDAAACGTRLNPAGCACDPSADSTRDCFTFAGDVCSGGQSRCVGAGELGVWSACAGQVVAHCPCSTEGTVASCGDSADGVSDDAFACGLGRSTCQGGAWSACVAPACSDAGTGTAVTMVATGEYTVLYLVDGRIYGLGEWIGNTSAPSMGVPLPLSVPTDVRFTTVQTGEHESLAVDTTGHVWAWGLNQQGQIGVGTTSLSVDLPTVITQDVGGLPFADVASVYCHISQSFAVKTDGSVWFWGDGRSGLSGDPANVGTITRPTRVAIPLPAGVRITRMAVSDVALALASDGTVWSWGMVGVYGHEIDLGNGADGTVPRQVTALPHSVVALATAGGFNYALTGTGDLWAWGVHSEFMGRTDGLPITPPAVINHAIGLPSPVHAVGVDDETTHVVLDDGTLWGWGAAGQGEVGNGTAYDFSMTDPPYGTWGGTLLMQTTAVRIAPGVSTFEAVWGLPVLGFYVYAQTRDGQLYFMGRNKNGIAGNGVYPGAASGDYYAGVDVSASYPSSWNVSLATPVSPMTLLTGAATLSPFCIAHPAVMPCNNP